MCAIIWSAALADCVEIAASESLFGPSIREACSGSLLGKSGWTYCEMKIENNRELASRVDKARLTRTPSIVPLRKTR